MGNDQSQLNNEKLEKNEASQTSFGDFSFSLHADTGSSLKERQSYRPNDFTKNILNDVLLSTVPYDYAGGSQKNLENRMMEAAERSTANIANLRKAESKSRTTDYDLEYERLSLREAT